MKRAIIISSMLLLIIPLALAHFMSEYPDFMIKDSKIDAIVVVGQKAPSTHVIAQSQIISSLSMLVDERPKGIAKLDSEVSGIENLNIISIGNACINSITSEILGSPEPCDKGLEPGKATIQVFEGKNEEVYIVLNAFSDKGIRKAADVMANYKNYKLNGDLIEIDVEDEVEPEKGIEAEEIKPEIEEHEPIAQPAPEQKEEIVKPKPAEKPAEKENFISRFIKGILALFGK